MISTINCWYGRLGNNIQQISNAIFFCMKNNINFYCSEHELINSFCINFGKDKSISGRFFFYDGPYKDFECNINELNNLRREICLKYIVPNFKFFVKEALDENTVVIHLRGGDIFTSYPPSTYVPNPINFYEKIIEKYEYAIIVSEDKNNFILDELSKNKKVFTQNSDIKNDFSTLLRAKNLVSSGVGTFSIAAALCSNNLKKIYCTNLYLTEHLNPTMLQFTNINLSVVNLNNYIDIGKWKNSQEQINLIKKYRIEDVNTF